MDSGQCYGQTVPLFQRWKVSFSGHWIPHPWYANGPASGAKRPSWMVFDDLGKRCNNQPCFTCVQAALCLYWHQHSHRWLAYAPLRKTLPRRLRCLLSFFVFLLILLARMYLFVILGGWLTEIPHPITNGQWSASTSVDTNGMHVGNRGTESVAPRSLSHAPQRSGVPFPLKDPSIISLGRTQTGEQLDLNVMGRSPQQLTVRRHSTALFEKGSPKHLVCSPEPWLEVFLWEETSEQNRTETTASFRRIGLKRRAGIISKLLTFHWPDWRSLLASSPARHSIVSPCFENHKVPKNSQDFFPLGAP